MTDRVPSSNSKVVSLRLDRWGRLALPAAIRKSLDLKAGDEVLVRVEEGELRISSHRQTLREAQDLVVERVAADRSLVDELIAARRSESRLDG